MHDPIKMIETVVRYRGSVLNDIAWLERLIDNYIIYHFTTDEMKVIEMQLLIFGDNRMILENKRQIFDYLALKHDYDWYLSYSPIRKIDYKKSVPMNKDLIWVIEERNKFAHLLLDTTEFGLSKDNCIGFLRYKNSTERIEYGEDDFKELMFTIRNLSFQFSERVKLEN